MNLEVTVHRWFPTFDFVVGTTLTRDQAVARLAAAFEEPSSTRWPSPKPHLTGKITGGGVFSCSARTSALGSSGQPNVSGEIVPAAGGSNVVVRVTNWLVYLLGIPFIGLIVFAAAISSEHHTWKEWLQGAATIGWLVLILAGVYWFESAFIRKIFVRIYSPAPPN